MLGLFFTFFKIGSFTFGGGYAMVPLIEEELVTKKKLINSDDFLNYLSVSQSFPGPISVNLSLLLGYKFHGTVGSIICVLGAILPSFFSILVLAYIYNINKNTKILKLFFEGISPVVVALLVYSFFNLFKNIPKNKLNISFLAISFLLVSFFKVNPIWIILIGGTIGLWLNF